MPRNVSPSTASPRSTRNGNMNATSNSNNNNNTNNFTTTSTTSLSPAKSSTSSANNNNNTAASRNSFPANLNLDSTLNSSNGDATLSKTNPFSAQGIVVAVRVRPFNKRELKEPVAQITTSQSVAAIVSASPGKQGVTLQADTSVPEPIVDVETDGRTVSILDPSKNYAVKVGFQFDHVFSPFVALEFEGTNNSSMMMMKSGRVGNEDENEDSEAVEKEQQRIFQLLGVPVVENALFGFNTCLFCYGATASGKTFTMMGTKAEPGIVPRVCRTLFKKLEAEQIALKTAELTAEVEGLEHCDAAKPHNAAPVKKEVKIQVQYLEIYQERVRDLLRPRERVKDDGGREKKPKWNVGSVEEEFLSLKVRQHPIYGPFVDGLTKLEVTSWIDCVKLIRQGNELRVAATTDMNDSSSRSHAIFQIMVTQTEVFGAKVRGKDIVNHRTSKINLVDLAGSERQGKTNVTGKHLIEANYINTSLSTLRKVIDVLNIKKKGGSSSEKIVVPYRESLLTWILSDNFGGNSKTAMIANVSPHWSSLQDSESTLRYATLAKGIVNRIRVNEDPSAKLIRDLQNQLKHLQDELRRANTSSAPATPSSFFNGGGGGNGMTREIEEQMEENKKALEELETKENGMMEMIREARQREEQLRMEKEGLERDQLRWKREAERLAREKVELIALLQKHGLDAGAEGNSANFWHDGSAAGSEYGGGGDTGVSNLDVLKKNQKKAKKSKGDEDAEDSRQTTPHLGVAKKKKRQDDESATNDGRRQDASILFDESSPSVVNESFSCPIVQPKKYARRRTSVVQPSDIIPPGTTGLEDSGEIDASVRNVTSSESNSNRDRERRSTSASSSSNHIQNQNNNNINNNNILSSSSEKYHQSSNSSSSMPPPPSSLPPDVAMMRHQRMQNQQQLQQQQQSIQGKMLPNSRGSANSALASHDALSSDDRNAAAMLLGSLINEHQSNHKRKNSKTNLSSNNNNNNNDDGTSSNTSRKSSKRSSKQARADSADSSNSSRREREGKESKSKKEKKEKKDKKTSGRKDSFDEELVDPFAEFGPKSSSAWNNTNSASSVSATSKKPSISGISNSSASALAVLTETSIPSLLSHEKDYVLLSKNNTGHKPTSSASSTSVHPNGTNLNNNNIDNGGTPQHGRRSAPGGGLISTPSSNVNNNSNPNLPPLPLTGRRSANNNNNNNIPPSVSPPPQGAPLSLIGNISNNNNRSAVSPSQPQFSLQNNNNNNVNGSFGGSRPNSNALPTHNDSLDQFMQNNNGEQQHRVASGRRKNVQ